MIEIQKSEYLNQDTLLFWMKFYFNKNISECIAIEMSDNCSIDDCIKECNKKFINFCHRITNVMNDKLYNYYEPFIMQENEENLQNTDDENEIDDYEKYDFNEYISDDPYDYLSNNATAIDKLQMYLSIPIKYDCFSWDVNNIFDEYNTNFMGLDNNGKNLKIYTPIFCFQIYKLSDAIDISIVPTDINMTKEAIISYFNLYKNNRLSSHTGNIRTYDSSIKRFYNYLIESECILSSFYYEGEEHLHALFSLAIDNDIKINSIRENKICINAEDFVNNYGKCNDKQTIYKSIESSQKIKNDDIKLKRLSEVDIHIISVKHHIEETTGEKATYKKIANYMSKNRIYIITENNIKQRVNTVIYSRLCVNDLTQAVYLLKDNNMLKSYSDI